jgi:hypothetical protein
MNVTAEDLRFAELVARTGLEPGLAGRLGAELGALYPQFGTAGEEGVRVESLTTDLAGAERCICASLFADTRVGA